MDKLDRIFSMQKALDDDITSRRHLEGFTPQEWIQKDVLAIIAELGELLDEVNFKWWKNPKEINAAAVQEEMVDVFHFFVSMCIRAGMSAEDLFHIYSEKNKENVDRQHGRSQKPGYAVLDGEAGV